MLRLESRGLAHALLRAEGVGAQLFRGGLASLILKATSVALSMLMAIVLARLLGAAGYGLYSFVFALLSLLAVPCQLGLPTLVVRETAKAEASGDWGQMRAVWTWATQTAGLLSLALACVGLIAALVLRGKFSTEQFATFAWGLILVPLIALGNLRAAALRGLRRVVLSQLPEFVIRPGLLIAACLAIPLVPGASRPGAAEAMALTAFAALAAFVVGALALARVRPSELKSASSTAVRQPGWWAAVLPLALMSAMQLVNQHLGVLMLGPYTDAAKVGVYRVVIQGAALVILGSMIIEQVLAPHLARIYARKDRAELQRYVSLSSLACLAMSTPIAVILVAFGEPLLAHVFGPEFRIGYWPLVVIVVGRLVSSAFGVQLLLLSMTGHERFGAISVGIAVACNALLNILLLPHLGILGAAFSSSASLICWNASMWVFIRRHLGVESSALQSIRFLRELKQG